MNIENRNIFGFTSTVICRIFLEVAVVFSCMFLPGSSQNNSNIFLYAVDFQPFHPVARECEI